MLQNYFKVALRNILKHKFYSLLNIAGLALGLMACFLIGLYVYDEVTYDQFHKDSQNIYCIALHGRIGGQDIQTASSCPPLSQAMVENIPGVEQAIRLNQWGNLVIKYEDKAFTESKALLADSNFFEFFSFKLLEGDAKTCLKEPNTMVMTKKSVEKYFGNEPAIGKIVTVGEKNTAFKVTGIVEEAPSNSQFQYDMIISSASDDVMRKAQYWTNNSLYTYYRKNPNTPTSEIDINLRKLMIEHVGPELEAGFQKTFEEFERDGGIYSYYSYSLESSHLYRTELNDGFSPGGDIKYVYIIGAVGIFILVIACINFMNLSTARSASRAKEVGLRKTLGSVRSKLILQFLSESFVYTLVGTVVAFAGVYLLLPAFNLLSGKELSFNVMYSPVILGSIAVIFLGVSLLAGSYPAFYLTSFNPVDVLKGKARAGMKSKGIRSTLVVVQFTISIALIICTMVVYNQLNFLQEKNIGLDKQNVLVLRNTARLANNQDAFRESLNNQTGIVKASYTNNVFPGVNNTTVFRSAGTTQDRILSTYNADYDHLNVLKMELTLGRFFSKDFPSDSTACVINEAAVRELGWPNPLNEKLTNFSGPKPKDLKVIGVVKDFNFESFKEHVRPMVIVLNARSNNLLIRYEGNAQDAVASVETLWKKYASHEPFEYTFLDENFDGLFREEQRLGKVFSVMTGIAIFVACLGLMGLASFTAEQRTKEIGIRKVMGATVSSVNTLLSKEFMILVAIAFVAASGLAWYAMDSWLGTFAYRINLGPELFVLSGLIAAIIAWLTVSFHFIKAARSNPSDALRYE
jgi:putative ABC transport system permease protein